jgi:choline kinase
MKAVILAAWVWSRIRPLTDNCPKSLLKICDKTILESMLNNIRDLGIYETVIITGYLEKQIIEFVNKKIQNMRIHFVTNKEYEKTNTWYSLLLAKDLINGDEFVKFDADVVFDKNILKKLLEGSNENYLCIDKNINLDLEEIKVITDKNDRIVKANKDLDPQKAIWESIGIEKIWEKTSTFLFQELELMMRDKENHQKYYESAYERLIEKDFPFYSLDITGARWVEIDTIEDYAKAKEMFM